MTFFLDNNLSPRLARGMTEFGEDVRHLRDYFAPDAPDTVWLPAIGANGWFLISRDKRIATRPAEAAVLKARGIGAFFFVQRSDPDLWGWVEVLVKRWRDITSWAASEARPFVAAIPERGKLRNL